MTGGGEKVIQLYPLMREGKLPFRNIDDILRPILDRLLAVWGTRSALSQHLQQMTD